MIRQLGEWTYRFENRLGSGGFAQAYRGRNPAVRPQEAAIKVFRDASHVNTFEKEVRALETMAGCSGTPQLIDHGRNRVGDLCIVTALVPGLRLDKHVKVNGPLSSDQTGALIRQLLKLLEMAHGRGLLHKDIKASNILTDGERYTLIDWGGAEPIGDGRAEVIRAKQDYVAPECYFGRHAKETDLYSLGWLIVYATTGVLPYHFENNPERDYRVAAHCLEQPELPPQLPPEWLPLVSNWVAKAPEQRFLAYDLDLLMKRVSEGGRSILAQDYRNIGRNCGFLRQAAEAGVPYAQHELAVRLLKDGRQSEALFWLEKANSVAYARSTYRLAMLLMETKSAAADSSRIRDLLFTAARANNPDACYQLAKQFLSGKDDTSALLWLARAAASGHKNAQYQYARYFDTAAGASGIAMAYYGAAAERGHARAAARLREVQLAQDLCSTMSLA